MRETQKKAHPPITERPGGWRPPMTAAPAKKKSAKLNPAVLKQRRETIEKRILKLEGKLNKDRALLLRYTDEEPPQDAE
jgi:hypothetical protein